MSRAAGQPVTETFDYDGGRRVTVYVPAVCPESIVFAGDGGWHISRLGKVLKAASAPSTMIVGVHGLAGDNARLQECSPVFDAERFAPQAACSPGCTGSATPGKVTRLGQQAHLAPRVNQNPRATPREGTDMTDASTVLLLAADSWGGVASMITLAEALRRLGVSPRIAAYSDYGDKVRAAGFGFIDFGVSIADYSAEQNAQRPGWARNPLRTWTALRSGLKDTALAVVSSVSDAVEPGEVIVSGTLTVGTATGIAGLRGGRVVAVNPAPMTPSRLPEASLSPVVRRPSLLNEWVGRFGARVAEWLYHPAVSAGREALGLPPWTARDYLAAVNRTPTIYGVSPALMPADPVLYLFWSQRDLGRQAWSWVEQLLPGFGTLDPQARAELAWAAAVLAGDIGDDAAALAARQRLAPLLPGISDPFLHAVARLAMAWTLPVAGDYGGALREAAAALEELRGQDEPVFTGIAAFTAGSLEMALGHYDDALRHLREARDLAERVGADWLAAGARVQLGILDVVRDSLDEARPLLEEALDLSLAARSTSFVTLCLAGYAQLAFADGDPDRAARLEGAAEGLRRRAGLSAWPQLRKVEAELVAQARQRLGAARFDRAFSAGSRLTQQQAVAIVRDQRGTGTQTP